MNPEVLAAQLESQRLSWVTLPAEAGLIQPPKGPVRVKLATPSQFTAARILQALRSGDGDTVAQVVAAQVRDLENVDGVFILGQGVGSSEPAPCSPRLVALLLADRPEWTMFLADKAIELAAEARAKVVAVQGN